jgi:hypothetical protein
LCFSTIQIFVNTNAFLSLQFLTLLSELNKKCLARRLAPQGHRREFAYIVNTLLRKDDAKAAKHVSVVVRAVNRLLVSNRHGNLQPVLRPADGKVYRGGGLPYEYRHFFQIGHKYRVPGFLATSLHKRVAETFMGSAYLRGEPCVMWIIQVDPDCKHVNYVTKTNVQGEEEYLFAPYAPFTVQKVRM